jgi:hypothetical protein
MCQEQCDKLKCEGNQIKNFDFKVPKDADEAFANLKSNVEKYKELYIALFIVLFVVFALFEPKLFIAGFFGLAVPVAYFLCQDFEVKQVEQVKPLYVLIGAFVIMPIIAILAKDLPVLLSLYFIVALIVLGHAIFTPASACACAEKKAEEKKEEVEKKVEEEAEKKVEEAAKEVVEEKKDEVKTD